MNKMGECTPVIVRYYSLSEPSGISDSEINSSNKTSTNHTISEENIWVPGRHSKCVNQQLSPKSHKSARGLQDGEDGPYDLSVHRPRSNTNAYVYRCTIQPKHVTNNASGVDVDYIQSLNLIPVLPTPVHGKCAPSLNSHGINFAPSAHEKRSETKCTQRKQSTLPLNQNCLEPRNTSVSVLHPRITHIHRGVQTEKLHSLAGRHNEVESEPMFSCNSTYEQVSSVIKPTVKIYEQKRLLVGKFYQDLPGSAEVAESERNSDISYACTREPYRKEHRLEHFASTELFKTPACQDGPFQIQIQSQNDVSVRSKKRKSRQPRHRRVESDDPAHFHRSKDNEQLQKEKDCPEKPFHLGYPHKTNPFYLQKIPRPKEACNEITGDVEVPYKKNEIFTRKDFQSAPPSYFDSTRSCDDNILKNILPRSCISGSEVPSVILPPPHYSSEGRGTTERCDPFLTRGPLHDRPSSETNGSSHYPPAHITLAYEMNSPCQFKITKKINENSYQNTAKHPFNFRPEWNVAQQYWHDPAWMTGRERKFETSEKGGPSYNSGYGGCPSGKQITFSDPSQHNMPKRIIATFPSKMNSVSSAERREENVGYDTEQRKDKPFNKTSKPSPSSLASDDGNCSSATVEVSVELKEMKRSDRPIQHDQPSASTNDMPNTRTKGRDVILSENGNFFLQMDEVSPTSLDTTMKERRFVCRYCDKKFTHNSKLQIHLRTHTGYKPFQCKFCSRRFAQSGVLKTHLRTHTGDKPFVCVYCRKSFAQSTTLTNHLRTHTGQKPYVCNFCGKSFSQFSTHSKHELSHTKIRPYTCKFCGKALRKQSTLTHHVRSHTGQVPILRKELRSDEYPG